MDQLVENVIDKLGNNVIYELTFVRHIYKDYYRTNISARKNIIYFSDKNVLLQWYNKEFIETADLMRKTAKEKGSSLTYNLLYGSLDLDITYRTVYEYIVYRNNKKRVLQDEYIVKELNLHSYPVKHINAEEIQDKLFIDD
jgi:hypothetical protein